MPNPSRLPMGLIVSRSLKFNISSSTWYRLAPPTYFVKSYYSNEDANERGAGGEWHQLSGLSERLSWGGVAEPSSLVGSSVCWGTCIGWHMAKSEGDTSSLMSPLLHVLIHGI